MLMERREIAESLRDQLHETEIAVEKALIAISRLTLSLPEARARCNISPVVGQAIFDSLGAATRGIIEVRGHVATAHGQLEATREQFRFPIVGTGAGSEKPPRLAGMAGSLTEVADKASEAA